MAYSIENSRTSVTTQTRVHVRDTLGGANRSYYNMGVGDKLVSESGKTLPIPSGVKFHTATCQGVIPDAMDIEANPFKPKPGIVGIETKFLGYGPVSDFVDISQITNPKNWDVSPFACGEYLGMTSKRSDGLKVNTYLYLLKPDEDNKCFGGGVLGDTGVDGQIPFKVDQKYNLTDKTQEKTPTKFEKYMFC